PPNEPTSGKLFIAAGIVKHEQAIDYLPDLREMIAAGIIEGVINLRRMDARALIPTREQDGFEKEIAHLSRNWNAGKTEAGGRAALFIKGKVKGEYLLTLAYDSEKTTRERLFRDIQPEDYYPVYGDSSIRTFDAQSTGKLYLRVDNKKSYLLYGDFNTAVSTENRRLSNYSRSLTGIVQHYENNRVSANVFASRDSLRQVIDEFAANGTSGPFTLTRRGGLLNSEKVEVLTRDRNQTAVVLRAVPLIRFVDYELEPLTGRVLLKAPVPSLDENLNPQSLRITYEVDQGGADFWVTGADVQFKVTDRIEVGAMVVDDRNPMSKFRMTGVNAVSKLADKTFLIAELAQTSRDGAADGNSSATAKGNAGRIELKHQSAALDANLSIAKADVGFENQSSNVSRGRAEAAGKLAYRLDEKTRILGELLVSEDKASGGKREGVMLSVEKSFGAGLRLEVGLRHAREVQGQAQVAPAPTPATSTSQNTVPSAPASTQVAPPTPSNFTNNEVTTVRAKLAGGIPGIQNSNVYGEAEFDLRDTSRKILAVGGEYQISKLARVYARHEFASSITGPYGLNAQQRQNATVFGVNTEYMKDGNLFSEYRVRDAISGGDAEAALGLRNTWKIAEGVKLQTGFERVHALSGKGDAESKALTFGLEYTANPLWKASSRLELRDGKNQDSILSTIALASKLNRDWTLLGRNTYSVIKNKGQTAGENKQERMQLGLAYRDTDNDTWNALGRIEHRAENDTTQADVKLKRTVEMVSLHASWQPVKPFTFSGRYAAKRVNEGSNGITSKSNAQLLGARAIWEVAPRWDVALNTSTMFSQGKAAKQYGLGVELGFMVMENLWLSAGYNWFGYKDQDLTASDYTNKGVFVRLRYKFDEDLFKASGDGKSPSGTKTVGPVQDSAANATLPAAARNAP
ncbi:MAG: hypothetical protein H7232_13345, partial [Aeromicrobium sp.]|nr:hypothetical protein [Burkholderiales bacterium]